MLAHENPFSTQRLERLLYFRPEWVGVSWEELEESWKQLEYRACLIGRHGAGKTTLLDAWGERLESEGEEVVRVFLNRQSPELSCWDKLSDSAGKFVFVDGDEQLGWLARKNLYRLTSKAKGMLVTRHSSGHLPTLIELDPRIQILKKCLAEVAPEFTQIPELEQWWKDERGNIRKILLRCYDYCRNK